MSIFVIEYAPPKGTRENDAMRGHRHFMKTKGIDGLCGVPLLGSAQTGGNNIATYTTGEDAAQAIGMLPHYLAKFCVVTEFKG